jgi:DNA-binding transcriptional MerR regulator
MAESAPDRSEWMDRAEVARKLGVSAATVQRLHSGGHLRGERAPDGRYLYSPEAVEKARDHITTTTPEVADQAAELLAAAATAVKIATEHAEKAFGIGSAAAKTFMDSTTAVVAELRNECADLRAKQIEFWKQREEVEGKKHERELEQLRAMHAEKRLDSLAQETLPHLATAIQQFVSRYTGGGGPAKASGDPTGSPPPEGSPPAAAPASDPSKPPTAPGSNGAAEPMNSIALLSKIRTLGPEEIAVICATLSADQVVAVMTSLGPRLQAVDEELSKRRGAQAPEAP